jgi:filamentous hemagglutinin family protein
MSLKNSLSWSLLLCTFTPSSWAEITLDGSLGRSGALIGPNYAITADLGKQIGGNLFHSFRDFNLDKNERATFSGPDTVNNVISRVTGGEPSYINGLLHSTIPNADVYLLNPAGILFGKDAKLDVQGGFHASTADTLRLGSDGEFNASNIEQSVLTVATPSAFGFLAAKPAAITLQDSQLAVPTGKTLSLIGGEITLNNSRIFAESGRLNLASVASSGEVRFTETSLNLSELSQRGPITINQSLMNLNGEGGGNVFIRGGPVKLDNSNITSKTVGSEEGDLIDIQVEQLELQTISTIFTQTSGFGKGGNIFIKAADALVVNRLSQIYTHTETGFGDAGDIEIEAQQLTLTEVGRIMSDTRGSGKSGDILIRVGDKLTLSNSPEYNSASGIYNQSVSKAENAGRSGNINIEACHVTLKDNAAIRNVTWGNQRGGSIILLVADTLTIQSSVIGTPQLKKGGNNGGDIHLEAGQLVLTDGGQINASTFNSKEPGSIFIKVVGDLTISTAKDVNVNEFNPSGIFTESTSEADAGNSGNMTIEADQITLTSAAEMSSSIQGQGKAGNIEIKARQIKLDEAKILSKTEGQGEAGTIIITTAGTLTLSGSSKISTDSAPVVDRPNEMSDAGEIEITAQAVSLDDSIITSETTGKGGTITLDVKDALNIQSGGITTLSRQTGDAGKIDIAARQIKLTQGGEINSTTYGSGKGGSIKLNVSDTLTVSGRKSTFISSRIFGGSNRSKQMGEAGDAGTISIEANKINLIESAEITTSARNASGGDISITVPNSLYLQAGKISTDVSGGNGNGGNIVINNPQLTSLNKSEIIANAYQGKGGNINITADQFIRSADSSVDASSRLGIDGEINIEAKSYVGNGLIALPKNFLNPPTLQRCETRFAAKETSSRFIRANRAKMRRDELKEGVWGSQLDF